MTFERTITIPLNLPTDKNTFIIAIPRCRENLFQIIRDNHEWLSESVSQKTSNQTVFLKKINTQEEYDRLQNLIKQLRAVGSELFIDPEFHPKPPDQKTSDYILEFIKNKNVGTQYTSKSFYRITVFPFGFDYTQHIPSPDEDPERRKKLIEILDLRQEYLIVPLFIILKKGKTYEQMRVLSYNPDGTFNVEKVNANHFWRVEEEEEETSE